MRVDGRTLIAVLQMMRTQDAEANARPEEGGWRLHSVRPDGVTIMSVMLKAEAFPDGTDGTPEEFVVEIDRWVKALRPMGDDADISFEDGKVVIKGKGLRHTFRLVAVDTDNRRRFQLPGIKDRLTGECMVEAERIRALLSSVDEKRAEAVDFAIGEGGLSVSSYDEAGNGVDLTVLPDEAALMEGSARAQFPIGAWAEAVRAMPADTVLDIWLGDDMPTMVDLGGRLYDATWLCAPRIVREGP